MGRVVVGVDGSDESLEAMRWACSEAARRGTDLDVVHAWSYPYPGSRTGIAEARELMRSHAARVLEHSVEALGDSGDVDVEAHLVEASPIEALRHMSTDADLVVVASRGRGGFASLVLGSVSASVAGHTRCPTAIVRHDQPPAQRIVVGVDGSETSARALQFAVDEAALDGSSVEVVHVFHYPYETPVPFPTATAPPPSAEMTAAALEVAERAIADATIPSGVTVTAIARTGAAHAGLLDVAEGATMLVVGSHGHGGFARVLIGSVAMACAHHSAGTPVVVVPAPVPIPAEPAD